MAPKDTSKSGKPTKPATPAGKSAKPSGSTAVKKAPVVKTPTKLWTASAALSYRVEGQTDWTSLPGVNAEAHSNIGPVTFDRGSIAVVQKHLGNRCELNLEQREYSFNSIGSAGAKEPNSIILVLDCEVAPKCTFDDGNDQVAKSNTFPLARSAIPSSLFDCKCPASQAPGNKKVAHSYPTLRRPSEGSCRSCVRARLPPIQPLNGLNDERRN
ncbi:MAG: hypothetical protein Q9221_008828 [Calogaya cf. arnoldii]